MTSAAFRFRCRPSTSSERSSAALDDETREHRSCDRAMHRREIALLREYRTRLIADVVTGKLDVREAAAQLPDEVDEPRAARRARRRRRRGVETIDDASRRSRRDDRHERARPRRADRRGDDRARPTCCSPSTSRRDVGRTADRLAARRPARLRPRVLRRPRAARGLPARRRSPTRPRRSTSTTTARRGGSSSPGSRARSRKRGVIDVLRHGIKHGPHHIDLFYGTPSPGNAKAAERYAREPLQRHAPAPLQPRRDAARARPGAVHQRPAGRHLRAEEQPDQADGRRTPSSSTSATATRASCCSSSAAASSTSRSTSRRCASAPT